MKKRKTAAFLAALMICAWVPQAVPGDSGVLVAEAHSGRTDRYGGHRDNKNKSGLGSYHYHCGGHPAHLHENGVCPYASYVEEAAPAEETVAEAPENLYMVFDPIYYADHNSDLYEAFGYDTDQLQEHFLTCGMKEGRPGCADFNVAVYKEQNADLAAAYGFPHVNMDLIAGLPEDTAAGFRRSLDRCLEFETDNVTIHTLALKKGSRILTEGLSVPGPEEVAQMLDYAAPMLRERGYAPYYLYRQKYMSGSFENIGWTRPGAECWYNIDIMSELCSILSFGAGGSTKMVDPVRGRIQRVFHAKYPTEYIQRPEKIAENLSAFRAFHENMKK